MTPLLFFITRAVVFSLIVLASTVLAYSQNKKLYRVSTSEQFTDPPSTQGDAVDILLATLRLNPRGDGGVPSVKQDTVKILESSPDTAVSPTPTTVSTDHELRDWLYQEKNSTTGWRTLAAHALSERDVAGTESQSLPPFPSIEPRQLPIKAYNRAMAGGTSLADASRTSVGSIMPNFNFSEMLTI